MLECHLAFSSCNFVILVDFNFVGSNPSFLFLCLAHSQDNSFLGFMISNQTDFKIDMDEKKDIALVYGKTKLHVEGMDIYIEIIYQHPLYKHPGPPEISNKSMCFE